MIHLYSVRDEEEYGNRKVFDSDFKVDEMSNPSKYLVQYQRNVVYQTSCVQDCQIGCGSICMLCALCITPLGCCCCTNCCCCYQLSTSNAGLVQSFGRFSRMLKPGFNLVNPCSEEVRMVDMRIRVLDVTKQITMTKDNVRLTINSSVAFRVTNPVLSYYVIGTNQSRALHESTSSAIRQIIAEYTLDKALSARLEIAVRSKERVLKTIPAGIYVENIFIEQISVPWEMERDLTAAARQKRISEANIINSQADVQTASLMKQSAQLLDTKTAMQIRYLEMVEELGKRGVTLMMGIGVNKKGF